MKLLCIYSNQLTASARVSPYLPMLTAAGIETTVCTLGALSFKAVDAADAVWVDRVLLPDIYIDKLSSRRFVYDFDDALADLDPNLLSSFQRTMRAATVVLAGSTYLKGVAITAGARDARVLRTGVDTSVIKVSRSPRPAVIWLGSASAVPYIGDIASVLQPLPPLVSVILVSNGFPQWQVKSQNLSWSPQQEQLALGSSTIGLAPLPDTAAARGKCAYKTVTYMAAGLPVVASNVGANAELFNEFGCQGALVNTVEEFGTGLSTILAMDPAARKQLGDQNRQIAVDSLDRTKLFPILLQAIQDVAR